MEKQAVSHLNRLKIIELKFLKKKKNINQTNFKREGVILNQWRK